MDKKEHYKKIVVFIAGTIFIAVVAVIYGFIWYRDYKPVIPLPFWNKGNWLVIALYTVTVLLFSKIYGGLKVGYLKTTDIIYSLFLSLLFSNIISYAYICLINRWFIDPIPLLYVMFAEFIWIIIWTFGTKLIYHYLYPPRRMLVIYGDRDPGDFISKMNSRKDKYDICGSVHIKEGQEKIKQLIKEYEAVVIWDLHAGERNALLKYCFSQSIRCYVTPKISDIIIAGADRIHLFDTPLLLSRNKGLSWDQRAIKRTIDIVVSLVAIIILSPLMLLIALIIKIYDKGPVFYRQERLTLNGKVFLIYKFRSMCMDSEKNGAQLAKKHDDRITPVGNILRNLHFDELPQLFNILIGDMSVVGPRPERDIIMKRYEDEIPEFHYRLKVKAGLTGYAQVYGKYNTTPYDKLKLDLFYIENFSLLLDFKLMLMTVKILFQKDASEGIDDWQTTALKKRDKNKENSV